MTATSTAECPSRSSEQRPRRELPVLFHLHDVSRGPEAQRRVPVAEPDPPHAEPDVSAQVDSPDADALPVAEPPVEASATGWPTTQSPVSERPLAKPIDTGAEEHAASALQADLAPASENAASPWSGASSDSHNCVSEPKAEIPATTDSSLALTTDEVLATLADPPSPPASRPGEVRRSRPRAGQDDWVSTHGKYIAIGFVLALLGTVYLARLNRPKAPVGDELTAAASSDVGAPEVNIPEITASSNAQPAARATAAGGTSGQSPASRDTAPAASQASLHPPTIPQLPSRPSSTANADANLFPWAKAEERVASRPTTPNGTNTQGTIENHTLSGSAAGSNPTGTQGPSSASTAPPLAAAPAGSAPDAPAASPTVPAAATTPAYPNTGYPAEIPGPTPRPSPAPPVYAPAAPPAAPAYGTPPAQSPPSQPYTPPPTYSVPPPAYGPQPPAYGSQPPVYGPQPQVYGPQPGSTMPPVYGGAAPPPPTSPSMYPLPDNSARGARHEHTGSGLY